MKRVEFLGQWWEAPDWAKFITHDLDYSGAVIVWEKLPVFANAHWAHDTKDWLDPGEKACLGHVMPEAEIRRID
jgi:hypothetical protein